MIVSVATGPYAHVAALGEAGGDDGLEVRHERLEPGRILARMAREAAWDVAEMSLATTYIAADRGERRFVPLPVFPSRTFRHSSLYVAAQSALRDAGELRGRTIGVLRYAMTTAVWVRELLARQFGVGADAVRWVVGEDSPHPASVEPRMVEGAAALERMLEAGEIDCLISGRTPAAFGAGRLRRLFPDFGAHERAYYKATGVFPIMHVIVARRELVEQAPQAAAALVRRFEAAKARALDALHNFDVSLYPLPFLSAYVTEAEGLVGELWPYGVAPNHATLAAFGRALAEEGMTRRALAPEEVFG